jgi:hypothetical protein
MLAHSGGVIINMASMSGAIVNRGLFGAHYNSSNAVIPCAGSPKTEGPLPHDAVSDDRLGTVDIIRPVVRPSENGGAAAPVN